jgi:cation diffusion facilitator CzcD-associated flavoprotein CzcO
MTTEAKQPETGMPEHFNVIVVGAGLSGINAAYYLQTVCPDKSFVILEGRDAIGGTWDLFRYPGIRSDSDMFTFGYPFRPWESNAAIADGASILTYIRETAEAYAITRRIRFRHRVTRASWSSGDALWTIEAERGEERAAIRFTCRFLFGCTGYYDYATGHAPQFPGAATFAGPIVHPQHWPQDLDYEGKRVVVIGSGATAVTIVPELARKAAHVTMLQRSPTYIVSQPSHDALAGKLRRFLPGRTVYALARWYFVLLNIYFFDLCRRKPTAVKKWIIGLASAQLAPGYDVKTHFTPDYDPWRQRLCIAPDGDLFCAIRSGGAEVVTGRIATFTQGGIRLVSGQEIAADIIVTATGLKLLLLGGIEIAVDGKHVAYSELMNFKGVMFSDVPNLFAVFGYTNASWTLKSDLTCAWAARLMNHMYRHGYVTCTPRLRDPSVKPEPLIDFSSGYIQRGIGQLPCQGSKKPWKLHQNYVRDLLSLRFGRVADRALEFKRCGGAAVESP